jgi:hypothetical protein
MELRRFTREEVFDFVRTALPQYDLTDDQYEKIYKETEGNAFFIAEYLNSLRENRDLDLMSSRMADILKSRFIGISEKGLKLLNIASVFFDEIPVDMLVEISGMDKLELLDILDDLKARYIIKETGSKPDPGIIFTHQKLREFIYNQQSVARKQIIHGRIGKILSKMLLGLGTEVYVEARKYSDIAWIKANGLRPIYINELSQYLDRMDVIFNTIPSKILEADMLERLGPNCLVIDLASKPGGVDFDRAKNLGIKVIWALSLPGKVAPVTAANFIKQTIYNIIEELGV